MLIIRWQQQQKCKCEQTCCAFGCIITESSWTSFARLALYGVWSQKVIPCMIKNSFKVDKYIHTVIYKHSSLHSRFYSSESLRVTRCQCSHWGKKICLSQHLMVILVIKRIPIILTSCPLRFSRSMDIWPFWHSSKWLHPFNWLKGPRAL